MIGGYFVLIVVCSFYKLNPDDLKQWEDIAYRAGFIAICQVPLVVLLPGKPNIIGFVTGVGYERLNFIHQWIARGLLLTVIIHVRFWLTELAKYDYIKVKIQSDDITQKGLISGGILVWLVISAATPVRALSYEIFVVQHIISWLAFIVTLYMHIPPENQIWVWLPIAFWAFDRFARSAYLFYLNVGFFHKNASGLVACKATFEPLNENHTRITINNPTIRWEAGQNLFLTCHGLAPLSSHPFSIASLPSDGKLDFVVGAKKGATKKFFQYAQEAYSSFPTSLSEQKATRVVLIDGPYSRIRPLRQFDSLVFLAGSTGATFTVPLMRNIVQQWIGTGSGAPQRYSPPIGAVTRYIRFAWVMKKRTFVNWFASQLRKVVEDVTQLRNEGYNIAVDIEIYVTADSSVSMSSILVSGALPVGDEDKSGVFANVRGSFSSSTSLDEKTNPLASAGIQILPGRPNVQEIIRATAEAALGEMAVVVCGPVGLVQGAKNVAVAISDERGVHKGTGAQGIYVHAEAFGYA
jgi:predicted ferric reductase